MYHRRFLPQSWGFHWKQAPGCWPLQKKLNMKMYTNTRIFALFATRISNFRSLSSRVRIKTKIKMEFVDNIEIEIWLNVGTEIRMNDLVDISLCCLTFTVVFFFFTSLPDPLNIKIRTYGSEKKICEKESKNCYNIISEMMFFCFTCSVVFISVLLVLLQVCCLWQKRFFIFVKLFLQSFSRDADYCD